MKTTCFRHLKIGDLIEFQANIKVGAKRIFRFEGLDRLPESEWRPTASGYKYALTEIYGNYTDYKYTRQRSLPVIVLEVYGPPRELFEKNYYNELK